MTTSTTQYSITQGRPVKPIPATLVFRGTLPKTAAFYNVSIPTVRKWFAMRGLPTRPPGNYSKGARTKTMPTNTMPKILVAKPNPDETRGRKAKPIPEKFTPADTVTATAAKYGVSYGTAMKWMLKTGKGSKNWTFIRPVDPVVTTVHDRETVPHILRADDEPTTVASVFGVSIDQAKRWLATLR